MHVPSVIVRDGNDRLVLLHGSGSHLALNTFQENVKLVQRADRSPVGDGWYPGAQPSVQEVPLAAKEQSPGVKGNVGVGGEQLRFALIRHTPLPSKERVPKLHEAERLLFATYPEAQPRLHDDPEGIGPEQLPTVIGYETEGLAQGLAWQVTVDDWNVPAKQVIVSAAEGVGE